MKKLSELVVGDRLYEGAGKYLSRAGRLIAVMEHPLKKGVLFLLAIQRDNQLTLYQGPASGPYLSLARSIPANVFCEFCGVVNSGISIHDTPDEDEPASEQEAKVRAGKESIAVMQMFGRQVVNPTYEKTEPVDQPLCLVDFP